MNLLNKLPDEIYKLVYSYVFSPKQSIKRWDSNKEKYTDLKINKCAICKRHASTVAVFHVCTFCFPYNNYFQGNKIYCEDTLFCWFCIH